MSNICHFTIRHHQLIRLINDACDITIARRPATSKNLPSSLYLATHARRSDTFGVGKFHESICGEIFLENFTTFFLK